MISEKTPRRLRKRSLRAAGQSCRNAIGKKQKGARKLNGKGGSLRVQAGRKAQRRQSFLDTGLNLHEDIFSFPNLCPAWTNWEGHTAKPGLYYTYSLTRKPLKSPLFAGDHA